MAFPTTFGFDEIGVFKATRTREGFSGTRSFVVKGSTPAETAQRANILVSNFWGDGAMVPAKWPGQEAYVSNTDAYWLVDNDDDAPTFLDVNNKTLQMTDPTTQLTLTGCPVRIDVQYEPLDVASPISSKQGTMKAGTYATWRLGWSAEFKTIPDAALYWQESATNAAAPYDFTRKLPSEANEAFLVCYQDVVIKWNNVDAVTMDAAAGVIDRMTGATNSTDMILPGYGYTAPAGTVIFMGCNSNGTSGIAVNEGSAVPEVRRELEYTFRTKRVKAYTDGTGYVDDRFATPAQTVAVGWNHTFDPSTDAAAGPGWDRVVNAAGELRHAPSDLSLLFAP